MQARFIHDGDSIDYTPTDDVAAGDVVVQGKLVGIATRDIPANTLGSLAVRGVFDIANDGSAFSAGEAVYIGENLEATKSDNPTAIGQFGWAVKAAANTDPTVLVLLDP